MAVYSAAEAKRIQKTMGLPRWGYFAGLELFWQNIDSTTGAVGGTVPTTGTTATTWTINSGGNKLIVDTTGLGANRTWTYPNASDETCGIAASQTLTNKTLTTPTIASFANATHDHSDAAGGGVIADSLGSTGTTNNTFDIDANSATGMLRLQTTTGGTDSKVTLTNTTTAADVTCTLPALTGTLAVIDVATQEGFLQLAGSTSGSIKIAPTAVGTGATTIVNSAGTPTITLPATTCTLPGLVLDNTWSGTTNTFTAIVGNSLTGGDDPLGVAGKAGAGGGAGGIVAIAGGVGHTAAAGGAVTAVGGAGADTGAGGAISITGGGSGTGATGNGGAASLVGGAALSTAGDGGDVTITGGVSTTSGTGGDVTITSGASAAAGGTAGAVRIDGGALAGGTGGAITIGATNAASVGIGSATKTTTISGLGIIAETDTATNTVTDVLTLKHVGGTVSAGIGTGISVWVEDAGSGTGEEQASMDFSLATVTNAAEDCDWTLSLNLAGAITQALKLDSVNEQLIIGANATNADGINKLRIYPQSATQGSLVLQSNSNSGGDFATTVTQAASVGQAQTITIPDSGDSADTVCLLDTTQTLTGKTLTTPTIAAAGWTNANHTHAGATTGGASLSYAAPAGLETVSDAQCGLPFLLKFTITSGDLSDSWVAPANCQVVDAWAIKFDGAGTGGDTVQLINSVGPTAITDAASLNGADNLKANFTTFDDTKTSIAAAASLTVTGVEGGTDVDCYVYVLMVWE